MEKKYIQFLIEEIVEESLLEHRDELAKDYVSHIEKNYPELHNDLAKLAKFSVTAVRSGHSPTKKLDQLSGLLKIEPDLDPRSSGDTHGIRLYIDHFIDDNKLAGQTKRWYQSTLDQMLKKYYTAPRKKRERKFKKYLQKNRSKDSSNKETTQSESLKCLIDDIIAENFSFLLEAERKPFNMAIPNDIKNLSKIFTQAGHELYIVGGAVRDAVLGKQPKDYDLVTDANPDRVLQILAQFPEFRTLEIGKAFGVINVITSEGNQYEIATFREDI